MKKRVFFIAALAAAVFTSNDLAAQDMKPAGGEKNIEVNFTPLGANPISINTLRFRYFKSSDMAFRVGFSVSSTNTTTKTLAGPNNDIELENTESGFGLSINPGIEKHFAGTDRLSPYVGAVLNFNMTNSTETDQQLDGTTPATDDTFEQETTSSATTFGLNLVLGADWYFSSKIYMGTEVGFGFTTTSNGDTETTNPGGPGTPTAKAPGGSSFNLGPNFNSAIRLGYLF